MKPLICFRSSIYEKGETKSIIDFVQMVLIRDPRFCRSFLCERSRTVKISRSRIPFWILFVGVIMCAVILIVALQVGFGEGLKDKKV